MANDNNNINDLVSNAEDAPTAELESLHTTDGLRDDRYGELETDEDTFDIERQNADAAATGKSVAALESDLHLRNQQINRLQFDIEQLRSRWTGLEKEIKAREEITNDLNDQLAETRTKLVRTEELLSQRDVDVDRLQQRIAEQEGMLSSVEAETKNVSQTVAAGKTVIEELQDTVTRQQSQLQRLRKEKDAAVNAKSKASKQLASQRERNAALEKSEATQSFELQSATRKIEDLQAELQSARDPLAEARQGVEQGPPADNAATQTGEISEQPRNGLLIENAQVIADLKTQIARTERYADRLRLQLSDVSAGAERDQRLRVQLENAQAEAQDRIAQLDDQLAQERLRTADLEQQIVAIKEEFANEIRQLRFELGDAQQTIAGQDSITERLASDLMDNQSFKLALEQQLEQLQVESDKRIRDLDRRARRLQQLNSELEHKLDNKENAIAALLNELASRSHAIESLGEIENVIHEIDGRMSDRIEEKSDGEKDRIARLLIGNVDGQELQFPLFKDRLSIGRTANNDIQLRAQFISRRHALIVTENEQSRIIDWGSKNGVYVNDTRIVEHVLKNGDIVAIGTAEFRYEERPKR